MNGKMRAKPDSVKSMKKSIARYISPILMAFAAAVLSACSSDQKQPEYYDSVETQSLEIPEGLSTPDSSSALVINAQPTRPQSSPPYLVIGLKTTFLSADHALLVGNCNKDRRA